MEALVIADVHKSFGTHHALRGLSVNVRQGEVFGFLGPNGAGKTTTIRCVMDFIRPNRGQISIFGHDAQRDSVELKRDIGFLSSDNVLYGSWTALEHIRFVESIRGKSDYAAQLVRDFDLDTKAKFHNLSSGNKQKLSLILAIMHRPKLLIMDEPTRGLDPLLQNQIYAILTAYKKDGGTVFMSSHNLAEVEQVCDRVALIRQGQTVKSETMSQIRRLRTHIVTATFASSVKPEDFKLAGVTIEHSLEHTIVLKVHGKLTPTIQALARYELKDLQVAHASLEEIFLEYYKK